MTNISTTVASTAAAPAVPTVSSNVTIDWGSWLSQAVANETNIIESVAEAGVTSVLADIPFGSFVSMFIGPTVVKQYVDQALVSLEGILQSDTLSVSPTDTIMTSVVTMITQYEPALAAYLGSNLQPMIQTAIAKILPTVASK
jgi:hypothetical protein